MHAILFILDLVTQGDGVLRKQFLLVIVFYHQIETRVESDRTHFQSRPNGLIVEPEMPLLPTDWLCNRRICFEKDQSIDYITS